MQLNDGITVAIEAYHKFTIGIVVNHCQDNHRAKLADGQRNQELRLTVIAQLEMAVELQRFQKPREPRAPQLARVCTIPLLNLAHAQVAIKEILHSGCRPVLRRLQDLVEEFWPLARRC